jgi:hypothetical protein
MVGKRDFRQPGCCRDGEDFRKKAERLIQLINGVVEQSTPDALVAGNDIPFYFARALGSELLLFFAHPDSSSIVFPMQHGAGVLAGQMEREITINWGGRELACKLNFDPCEPCILLVGPQDSITSIQPDNFRPQRKHD